MTKRPERDIWDAIYREHKGQLDEIADKLEVSVRSVYNWLNHYKGLTVEKEEDYDSGATFDYYTMKHKDSLTERYERSVDISIDEDILIVCLSDLHLGSVYVDIDRLAADKKIIEETENVYAVFVGDMIDYLPSNRHKDLQYDQVFPQTRHTKDMALQFVKEIGHKMLVMLSGCHDQSEFKETGEYYMEKFAEYTYTKQFFPDAVVMNMTVGNITYKIYLSHKALGGSSYNPSHTLFRMCREKMAFDVGITAHKHTPGVAIQNILDVPVVVINGGTYKVIDTYANRAGYVQQPLSIPGFVLKGDTKKVIPFFDWRDGLKYVNANNSH